MKSLYRICDRRFRRLKDKYLTAQEAAEIRYSQNLNQTGDRVIKLEVR